MMDATETYIYNLADTFAAHAPRIIAILDTCSDVFFVRTDEYSDKQLYIEFSHAENKFWIRENFCDNNYVCEGTVRELALLLPFLYNSKYYEEIR